MKDTHTPPRSVRVPDEEWLPAGRLAEERGETLTDVIRRALRDYVAPSQEEETDGPEQDPA